MPKVIVSVNMDMEVLTKINERAKQVSCSKSQVFNEGMRAFLNMAPIPPNERKSGKRPKRVLKAIYRLTLKGPTGFDVIEEKGNLLIRLRAVARTTGIFPSQLTSIMTSLADHGLVEDEGTRWFLTEKGHIAAEMELNGGELPDDLKGVVETPTLPPEWL